MTELRRAVRRPVRQGAWIFVGAEEASIPCMILDLSSGGARLGLRERVVLPKEFILVMSRDGRLNRRCEVAWSKDNMIGVRFLVAKSIRPKQAEQGPRFEIKLPDSLMAEIDRSLGDLEDQTTPKSADGPFRK